MYLIQILLPLRDNDGNRYDGGQYEEVRRDLAEHFGGITTYMRSPATGLWENDGELVHDEIVIFEVMTDHMEREFWRLYRQELQEAFRQEVITMRASRIELL